MRRTALALASCLLAGAAWAGASSLAVNVGVAVLPAPQVCGSSADIASISVACVRPSFGISAEQALETALTLPTLAVDTVLAAQGGMGGGIGMASALQKVSLLPATVLGTAPVALYSSGATIGSLRTVTAENGSYVEITITW